MAEKQTYYDAAEARFIEMQGHFDEAKSIFLARQLAYVRSRVLQVPKAPLNAFTVFPVQTDVPSGAESAYQRIYDSVGMAEIISNYADDLHRVDVLADEIPVKVFTVGDAYGYNVKEIQSAQLANVNLTLYNAQAARRAIDQKLNQLAWHGDERHHIIGFLNNPNISQVTLTADGTGNSTQIATKTFDKVVRDFNEIINAIPEATQQVEIPNTVIMSTKVYDHVATTARSDHSDLTILDFLKRTHPEIQRWLKVGELNGAGANNSDVIIAGKFDPDYIKFEIPDRFLQMPVQVRNLEYVVNCYAYAIGVTVTLPMAFVKAEGA